MDLNLDKTIFQFYNQLPLNGYRSEAVLKMAEITGKKPTTVKCHWLPFKRFSANVTYEHKVQIKKMLKELLKDANS